MKKIKLTKKGDKYFVHPSELTINPLNKKIYNEEQDKEVVDKMVPSFKSRLEQKQRANEQPIMIWPDGLVDVGNTRTKAGRQVDCLVWVVLTDKPYPDTKDKPYTSLEAVRSSNIYRKMTHSVKLREFEEMNKAHVAEKGINRTAKQEAAHIKELGSSRDTIKKLQEIKKHRPDLLPLVDSSDVKIQMSVKTAWEEATGRNKTKVTKSNNPNRDWSKIYTTDIFVTIMNSVDNKIQDFMESSCVINGEDYYPVKDFTSGTISTIVSHLMETIGAEVLRSEGHDVRCATGHATDPDIYHIDIEDKIEIKVAKFEGSQTTWKGGQGIREGQYILVTYDEQIERYCVIFTPLTEKDWKSAGQAGHRLPIKNVFENHREDAETIYGKVFKNAGKIFLQLEELV